MSNARRAYDILRSYVNYGWERLQGEEEGTAERELKDAVERPYESVPVANSRSPQDTPIASMSIETARRLLDLTPTATSKEISSAHERVRRTADPTKFPSGSDAQARARHLVRLIDAAQRVLQDNIDPTIRRFEGLEIE